MSACATGCGRAVAVGLYVCEPCETEWMASKERTLRQEGIWAEVNGIELNVSHQRLVVARVDFCNRVRAERNNRGHNEP